MNERMLVRKIKKKFLGACPKRTGVPLALRDHAASSTLANVRSYPYRNFHGSPLYKKMMGRVPLKY